MDSLTHLVLGAVVGEIAARKQLGAKALALGAVAQYVPDLDVVAALWLNPADNLVAHRGITHSFLFVALGSVAFAWVARAVFRRPIAPWHFWIGFFALQLSLHIFIDAFNAYGAGWLEPFSSRKITFDTLYVVDPVFTLPLIVALTGLLFARSIRRRRNFALAGIALSGLYLIMTIGMRWIVVNQVESETAKLAEHDKLLVTPAPLNSLLWFVAAGNDSGFFTSYVSVFDNPDASRYAYFPRKEHLLAKSNAEPDIQTLKAFSQGYYTAELWGDTLVFNDLRFGQIVGWTNPRSKFVFHYFVDYPEENTLVMQRGRFARWDRGAVRKLLTRIRGRTISPAGENKR